MPVLTVLGLGPGLGLPLGLWTHGSDLDRS